MDTRGHHARDLKWIRQANITFCLLSLGLSILSLILDGFTVVGIVVMNLFVLFNIFFLSFDNKRQLFYLKHRVCSIYVFFGIITCFIHIPLLVTVIIALAKGSQDIAVKEIHSSGYNHTVVFSVDIVAVLFALGQGVTFVLYA